MLAAAIPSRILILCLDPLVAALVAALAELGGFETVFARSDEPARDTLMRLRPRLVLVDCEHQGCTEAFFGPVLMTGARVVIFGPKRDEQTLRELGKKFDLPVLTLPAEPEEFLLVLRVAATT